MDSGSYLTFPSMSIQTYYYLVSQVRKKEKEKPNQNAVVILNDGTHVAAVRSSSSTRGEDKVREKVEGKDFSQ